MHVRETLVDVLLQGAKVFGFIAGLVLIGEAFQHATADQAPACAGLYTIQLAAADSGIVGCADMVIEPGGDERGGCGGIDQVSDAAADGAGQAGVGIAPAADDGRVGPLDPLWSGSISAAANEGAEGGGDVIGVAADHIRAG